MKTTLLAAIRSELRSRLDVLARAAHDAHAAATDPGSKAEGKYDTRSLEASYLATGQARQVEELAAALRVFEPLQPPDFDIGDAVDAGALVEVDLAGESSWFLLAPAAGGLVVKANGIEVTLVSPGSPLYQNLIGLRIGESCGNPALTVMELL